MPTVTVTAPTDHLRLSDSVEITLVARGDAPLRVELPKDLLEPASAAVWQIEPVGDGSFSADGTTWSQHFRLSPFLPGDYTLKFNKVTVNGTEVTPESLEFNVKTKFDTTQRSPTSADARSVTGIEQLPGSPPADPPVVLAGLFLLSALVAMLAVVLVVAYRRKPKPVSAGEWVRERLDVLRADRRSGRLTEPVFVERLATVFREYLSRRFGLNTEKATTTELLASADETWDADTRGEVEHLLSECDEVKFAGRVPTPVDCEELAEQVERLVAGWEGTNRINQTGHGWHGEGRDEEDPTEP